MDDTMMKLGGEAKRRELISMFGDLSITEDKLQISKEEAKRATEGEEGQSKYLT